MLQTGVGEVVSAAGHVASPERLVPQVGQAVWWGLGPRGSGSARTTYCERATAGAATAFPAAQVRAWYMHSCACTYFLA